jgi:hypothetical protein
MRKLSASVVIATAVLTAMVPPATAEIMSKDMIGNEIIGRTLTTIRKGMTVRFQYNTDGTVLMKAFVISGGGTWKYNNDGVCMNMTSGPKKGETCVTFERLGGNKYRNSEGMVLTAQ